MTASAAPPAGPSAEPPAGPRASGGWAGHGAGLAETVRELLRDSRRRRDVLLALIVAAVIGLAVGLAVGLSGGSPAPPATGAARLVPADALAYLNVSLDRRRPGVARTLRLASTLSGYSLARTLVESRVDAMFGFTGAPPGWIGNEASLAVVTPGGGSSQADSLALLAVRRAPAARRYVAALSSAFSYRGVDVRGLPGGSYVALLGRYLVAGQQASVEQAIDVTHGAPSLSGFPGYRRAAAGRPPGRVLDLYAPAAGIIALLSSRTGVLGAARVLLSAPGLSAASASLSATPGGLRLTVHRVSAAGSGLVSGTAPGSASKSASGSASGGTVDGSLLAQVPAGTAFAIEVPTLIDAAPRLLSAASQMGIGSAIGPLLSRAGRALHAEGSDLGGVLSVFSHPTALAVTATGGRPDLLVLTRTSDPSRARIALADLAPALASLFPAATSGLGAEPLFTGRQIDGMTIHQLQLGPGLQLDYTVYHHLVGVSTSLALVSLARHGGSLGATPEYRTAFGPSGSPAGTLVFADLKVLIRLGEQTGLLHSSGFARLAPDLDRISVIGLRARSDKTESTSELYINIP